MTQQTDAAEDEALARAVNAVYGVKPSEFVATRKEWVSKLRSEGLREVARTVSALRKPSVSAAAVNALVRAGDPVVARLEDVGARMRHAQSTLDAAALAALRNDRDEVLASWVTAARGHAGGSLTAAVEAEVRDTAVAALADPAATEVVTSGSLTRALSYSGFGEVDVADAVVRTSTGVVLSRIEGGRREDDEKAEEPEGGEAADEEFEGDEDLAEDEDVEDEGAEEDLAEGQEVQDEDVEGEDEDEDVEGEDEDEDVEGEDEDLEGEQDGDTYLDAVEDEAGDTDLAALEMELDEAEKVVAAARAGRRTAGRDHAAAEESVSSAAEQLQEAERLLASARSVFEEAEEEQRRTAAALEEADAELRRSRRQRDEARAALEEAEDS
jgi:hypothetical protein